MKKLLSLKVKNWQYFLMYPILGSMKIVPSLQSLAKERGHWMNGNGCGLTCQKTFLPGNLSYANDNGGIKADVNVHRENWVSSFQDLI